MVERDSTQNVQFTACANRKKKSIYIEINLWITSTCANRKKKSIYIEINLWITTACANKFKTSNRDYI